MRPKTTQYLLNEEGNLLQGIHFLVTLGIKRCLRGGVGRLNFILARGGEHKLQPLPPPVRIGLKTTQFTSKSEVTMFYVSYQPRPPDNGLLTIKKIEVLCK